METVLTHRGRHITTTDVAFIRDLIAAHPHKSRRALSSDLCHSWAWYQENGSTRDMVCRSMMLELHRAGHIVLPPVRQRPPNPLAMRKQPAAVEVDQSLIRSSLKELGQIEVIQVRRTPEEALLNGLLEAHHYLGYTQPVGEHLKHLVLAKGRPVACFTFSSAPRHLGPRDRFIGWSKEARRANIRFLAYNSRFLIMPWVEVPHLASYLLGRMARRLSADWQEVYGHSIYFVETFIHPQRFKGTCYRAANFAFLGKTTGRGKDDQTGVPNRPIKDVLGLPLCRQFRKRLCAI